MFRVIVKIVIITILAWAWWEHLDSLWEHLDSPIEPRKYNERYW